MKRSAIRRKPQADPVSPELHAAVRLRDGECIAAKAVRAGVIESHMCRDRWGVSHPSNVIALMSVDHVHDEATMGKRAPSDMGHLVAMDYWMNINGVPAVIRQFEREYLRTVGAPEHPHVEPVHGCLECMAVRA